MIWRRLAQPDAAAFTSARLTLAIRRLLFPKRPRLSWQRLNVDAGNRVPHILQDQHADPAAARSRDIESHPAVKVLSLRERGISETPKRFTGIPGEHNAGRPARRNLEIVIGHDIPVLIAQGAPHGHRRRSR